jgi:hypothetical protein
MTALENRESRLRVDLRRSLIGQNRKLATAAEWSG